MNPTEIYQQVTNSILESLREGVAPWHKPWDGIGEVPMNLASQRPYTGINTLLLGMGADSPYWLTFNQMRKLGGTMPKGTKGRKIIFYKVREVRSKTQKDPATGDARIERIPALKQWTVFNAAHLEGIDEHIPEPKELTFTPLQAAQDLVESIQPTVDLRIGGDRAYFAPDNDHIQLPRMEAFHEQASYYSTLFHELTHWTGHSSRLDRATLTEMSAFGSPNYSKEELVAEMGSGFLCAMLGIENTAIDQSAAYIQNWLSVLKDDHKLVVSAASQAQKACNFLLANYEPLAPNLEAYAT